MPNVTKIDSYKKQINKHKNKLIEQNVVKNIFEKSTELVKLTKEEKEYLKIACERKNNY